ncbi:hypothetical protein PR202_ga12906 [Eleusine coracana subsp. coracana]|uniref:Membralin n=1 Tax=Eleusine coracana subsp. coracana TaxID=191504 RepID=A0AAV5CCR4_ELECO|nr:hypothetical protein PR202_ga12906 [Eleusine coracana subsp. coracana]
MDPEQTFLRVHARLSGMLSQLLTPRIRLALEYLYLAGAVALFCLLVVMHTNFVQQVWIPSPVSEQSLSLLLLLILFDFVIHISYALAFIFSFSSLNCLLHVKPGCSSEFSGIEFGEAQLVQIKIISGGLWTSRGASYIMDLQNLGRSAEKILEAYQTSRQLERVLYHPLSAKESFKAAVTYLFRKWYHRVVSFWRNTKQLLENTLQLMCSGLREEAKHLNLPICMVWRSRMSTLNLYSLFRWQQLLINSIVGYDTILTNSLVNSPGHGYLYNFQTKELYDLSYGHEPPEGPTRFGDYFVTKCGVLLMSLFVFFTTTMSVSFTLRETQSRMLRFTVQLQHHARHQLPTFQLIFVHVIESLVFVPIMIGILFFLFEFYDDQLLAFLVLTLVWLCELFTMISVRTSISMQFFPRFFLLYFLVFHIYFFSYTYGFSYLAFSATAAFMQHLILYFWNRFEVSLLLFSNNNPLLPMVFSLDWHVLLQVPALQRFMRSRAHIQQQTGVQITSSTIYTSTLHIARLNVGAPGTINDGLGAVREADALLVQDESIRNQQEGQQNLNSEATTNNPIQYQDQNPQQAGNPAAGSGSLNPFGSLLLWLLGGGASDGIVSFFSLFRDVRDHGQDFTDPPRNENDQVT